MATQNNQIIRWCSASLLRWFLYLNLHKKSILKILLNQSVCSIFEVDFTPITLTLFPLGHLRKHNVRGDRGAHDQNGRQRPLWQRRQRLQKVNKVSFFFLLCIFRKNLEIETMIIHESYDPVQQTHDIALLKVKDSWNNMKIALFFNNKVKS